MHGPDRLYRGPVSRFSGRGWHNVAWRCRLRMRAATRLRPRLGGGIPGRARRGGTQLRALHGDEQHSGGDRGGDAFRLGQDDRHAGGAGGARRGGAGRCRGSRSAPTSSTPAITRAITGRPSRNLDTWLLDPAASGRDLRRGCRRAPTSRSIEGVMGLFDGRGGRSTRRARPPTWPGAGTCRSSWSSMLGAWPARSRRWSGGSPTFDPGVRVAGVVANRVGSHRHYAGLPPPGPDPRRDAASSRSATCSATRRWRSPRGISGS